MRSKIVQQILKNTPEETKRFVRIYGDITVKINRLLREKGWSQKDLAIKLNKRPSEISKWLKGEHNFTLRSIAKLEAELETILIEVPNPLGTQQFRNATMVRKVSLKVIYKNTNFQPASTYVTQSEEEQVLA